MRKTAGLAGMLLMLIICLSAVGCSGGKRTDHMDEMKRYAEQKYGESFETVSYRAAKDETYYDVLVLSKNGIRFNVLRSAEGDFSDTYPAAVINEKMTGYFKDLDAFGLKDREFYLDVFPGGDEAVDIDFASNSAEKIAEYGFDRLTAVILTEQDIKSQKEALYKTYSAFSGLNPKHFSFEVLQIEKKDEKLMDMLNNMTGTYENDWNSFSGIRSWLSVSEGGIASADELVEGVH